MKEVGVDLTMFFVPGTRVLALPSWRNPKLYIPARGVAQRWAYSALYPAYRPSGRAYRLALRLAGAGGLTELRTVRSNSCPLSEFTADVLPNVTSAAVLVGTPGPAQEVTVQLRDGQDRVKGYVKFAVKDAARRRVRWQRSILSGLPEGLGARPFKFGPLGDGEALITSVIEGKTLRATLPPEKALGGFLGSLVTQPAMPLRAHPWVRSMRDIGMPRLDHLLAFLANRSWPVVIQHGDFAPWNLHRDHDGRVRAVDWEYGTLEGFPFLDLVYYILQVSALIYNRDPLEAAQYAAQYLTTWIDTSLTSAEAHALVRLAASDAYRKLSEDGQDSSKYIQAWRRVIFESEVPGTRKPRPNGHEPAGLGPRATHLLEDR